MDNKSSNKLLFYGLRIRNFLLGAIYLLPVFSLAAVFALYNREEESEYLVFQVKKHKGLWMVIKISAALSLFFILAFGIDTILGFIPAYFTIFDSENLNNFKNVLVYCFTMGFWFFMFNLLHGDKERTLGKKEPSSPDSEQDKNDK